MSPGTADPGAALPTAPPETTTNTRARTKGPPKKYRVPCLTESGVGVWPRPALKKRIQFQSTSICACRSTPASPSLQPEPAPPPIQRHPATPPSPTPPLQLPLPTAPSKHRLSAVIKSQVALPAAAMRRPSFQHTIHRKITSTAVRVSGQVFRDDDFSPIHTGCVRGE